MGIIKTAKSTKANGNYHVSEGSHCSLVLKPGHMTNFYDVNEDKNLNTCYRYRAVFSPSMKINGVIIDERDNHLIVLSDVGGISSESDISVDKVALSVEKKNMGVGDLEHSSEDIFEALSSCARPGFDPSKKTKSSPSTLEPAKKQYAVDVYTRDVLAFLRN